MEGKVVVVRYYKTIQKVTDREDDDDDKEMTLVFHIFELTHFAETFKYTFDS